MRVRPLAPLRPALLLVIASCTAGRSAEAWIASRDATGAIVAGAVVEVDGQEVGLTDERGLYHLKVERRAGERVRLAVYREALSAEGNKPESVWQIVFTVGTDGRPVEGKAGWLTAVLEPKHR